MNPNKPIRIAYGSVPKESGTFTFYKNHRAELLLNGIEIFCVSVGVNQKRLWNDAFADDHCVMLAANEHNLKKQAMTFSDWCDDNGIDIVMAINSEAIVSSLPHLNQEIRVVSRCANAFPEGYEVTIAGHDRLSKIVALTPRLKTDLVNNYNVDPDLIRLIPNGVDAGRFRTREYAESIDESKPIELGFLGRLEHKQKGVLYLPKIVEQLNNRGLNFRLRIAGTGVHETELKSELKEAIESGQVEFTGMIAGDEVAQFLESIEIYLFTSHFEGCPNALLEAMAAGCAPVSWVIPGITDFIISDGKTGRLIPMGDCEQFAEAVRELAEESKQLRSIGEAAQSEGRNRFSISRCVADYTEIFMNAMNQPAPSWQPQEWSAFQTPTTFQRKLGWIPPSIRLVLKRIMGKIG